MRCGPLSMRGSCFARASARSSSVRITISRMRGAPAGDGHGRMWPAEPAGQRDGGRTSHRTRAERPHARGARRGGPRGHQGGAATGDTRAGPVRGRGRTRAGRGARRTRHRQGQEARAAVRGGRGELARRGAHGAAMARDRTHHAWRHRRDRRTSEGSEEDVARDRDRAGGSDRHQGVRRVLCPARHGPLLLCWGRQASDTQPNPRAPWKGPAARCPSSACIWNLVVLSAGRQAGPLGARSTPRHPQRRGRQERQHARGHAPATAPRRAPWLHRARGAPRREAERATAKRGGGQRLRGAGSIHGSVDSGIYFLDCNGDGVGAFKNTFESEIKGARSAGIFTLGLQITDDDSGEAIRAVWLFTRGAAVPLPMRRRPSTPRPMTRRCSGSCASWRRGAST